MRDEWRFDVPVTPWRPPDPDPEPLPDGERDREGFYVWQGRLSPDRLVWGGMRAVDEPTPPVHRPWWARLWARLQRGGRDA